jgi:hypothetical protein
MSDPSRQLRGSIGAYESWAHTEDRPGRTAKARAAADARFEKMVDPKFTDAADRARRAENLRKAHYARMALKSVQARKKIAAGIADLAALAIDAAADDADTAP